MGDVVEGRVVWRGGGGVVDGLCCGGVCGVVVEGREWCSGEAGVVCGGGVKGRVV